MNRIFHFVILVCLVSCQSGSAQQIVKDDTMNNQLAIENETLNNHDFLSCMYSDTYFPTFLVDKCRLILQNLCLQIEEKEPKSLDELYALTHYSTEQINELEDEFYENNSEIETGARECLGAEFEFIAKAYGFDADVEELIATRDW